MEEAVVARYVNRARSTEVTVLLDPNAPDPPAEDQRFELVAGRDPRFDASRRRIEEGERAARLEDEQTEGRRVAPILRLEDRGRIAYRADAGCDPGHDGTPPTSATTAARAGSSSTTSSAPCRPCRSGAASRGRAEG